MIEMKKNVLVLLFIIISLFPSYSIAKKVLVNDEKIRVFNNTLKVENCYNFVMPDSLYLYKNIETVFFFNGSCSNSNKLFLSLSKFSKLKHLSFQNFKIRKIPKNIKNIKNLEILDIVNDTISDISSSLKHTKLTSLTLKAVNFGNLPEKKQKYFLSVFSSIKSLHFLSLENNNMDTIYDCLSKSNIEKLSIQNNSFKNIPCVLSFMMNNRNLFLISIDYCENLMGEDNCFNNVQRKDRLNYFVFVYFNKNTSNDEANKAISKLTTKYPQIESFGKFFK